MPRQLPWSKRRFSFNAPPELFPEFIKRLRGAPVRAHEFGALPPEWLTHREGDKWSIQEHIGHLADLDETLFMDRLDQFTVGAAVLTAADMSNRLTNRAHHNDRPIADVLARFDHARAAIVAHLETLESEDFARTARHPRLNVPMRLIDMLSFHGEHDDYHLAKCRSLSLNLSRSMSAKAE